MDADGSGFIDYSEFCVAAINKRKLLTNKKLKQAFNLFDRDKGGQIDSDELKHQLFGDMQIDEATWDQIISEIDQDGKHAPSVAKVFKVRERVKGLHTVTQQ